MIHRFFRAFPPLKRALMCFTRARSRSHRHAPRASLGAGGLGHRTLNVAVQGAGGLIFALSLVACTPEPAAQADAGPAPDAGAAVAPPEGTAFELCPEGVGSTARPLLRRLTHAEIERATRDAFVGALTTAAWPAPQLPADPAAANGFANQADRLHVTPSFLARWNTEAEHVGTWVAAHAGEIVACAPDASLATCQDRFLDTVGRRLARRPLSEAQRTRLRDIAAAVSADTPGARFAAWSKWATVALLMAPRFLYRVELPAEGTAGRLDAYDTASFIAFSLTGHPPSDALLDAAAAGDLDTTAGAQAAARALLDGAHDAFGTLVADFTGRWLKTATLPFILRGGDALTPQIKQAMTDEQHAFVMDTLWTEGGSVADMLHTRSTHASPALAAYYGDADVPDARWGRGVLALGAVQTTSAHANSTSPTLRGLLVREKVLCDELGEPPPVVGEIPAPTGAETTRQRYEDVHAANPACNACHQYFDPLGFAFEHRDQTGRYRADENGLRIDTSGALAAFRLGEASATFNGPDTLMTHVLAKPRSTTCVASNFAAYLLGVTHHEAACLSEDYALQHHVGDIDARTMLIRLVTADRMLARAPAGEVPPGPSAPDAGPVLDPGDAGPIDPAVDAGQPDAGNSAAWTVTPDAVATTSVSDSWSTGGCIDVAVQNTGTEPVAWVVSIDVDGSVVNMWNAVYTARAGGVIAHGRDYNRTLEPGAETSFGFCYAR